MYSVVGCRKCEALWIVEDRPETTQCTRCRKRYQFKKLTKFAQSSDLGTIQQQRSKMLADRSEDGQYIDPAQISVSDTGIDDEEYLSQQGLDLDLVDELTTNDQTVPFKDTKQIILEAIENLDTPTFESICQYAQDREITRTTCEEFLEKLRMEGTLIKQNGRYRKI